MTNRCAFGVVMLFSFLLLACQPIVRPTDVVSPLDGPATAEIPFETISLNETGEGIRDSTVTEETQLLLLTTPEQVDSLKTMVNSEDFAQLQQVDYTTDAVVALFRGWRGSHNYQTIIEQITQEKEHLRVHAQFWEPSPYWASAEEITYPYHLVKIHKGDLPSRQVELELEPVAITPTPPTIPGKSFLAFETIYQGTGRYNFQQAEMDLFLMTSASDLDALLQRLSPIPTNFANEMSTVDYAKEIVLMAYHGFAPTNAYRITIQEISYQDDIVNTVIQITGEGAPADGAVSYPVHIIRVEKLSLPRQEELLLRVWHEGEVLLERRFIVP